LPLSLFSSQTDDPLADLLAVKTSRAGDRDSRARRRWRQDDGNHGGADYRGGAAGARTKVMTDGVIDGAPPV